MDYREELARRLERVPFSARQIAALAGVSAAWVSKAKKRQAHKITLETSQRIHAAIDKLADQARSMPAPPTVTHPGIEALAQDAATLTRYGITPDELDLLRSGIYPVTIMEKRDALDMLLVLRRVLGE